MVFRPDTAAQYTCLAYLDVAGREDRLPLRLSGRGIGPNCQVSIDVLDIGDVFINLEQMYEISIVNKGDIIAHWTFMPPHTRFGNKFTFYPKEGSLQPGETAAVSIRFESDILGEFSEFFRFSLQGNENMLECNIKGNIVGPTFHFDTNKIDFGIVSYDYLHSQTVRLVNSSTIPIVFNLHVPQDGAHNKREFNVTPARGTLLGGDGMDVVVEFIPGTENSPTALDHHQLTLPTTICNTLSYEYYEYDVIYILFIYPIILTHSVHTFCDYRQCQSFRLLSLGGCHGGRR